MSLVLQGRPRAYFTHLSSLEEIAKPLSLLTTGGTNNKDATRKVGQGGTANQDKGFHSKDVVSLLAASNPKNKTLVKKRRSEDDSGSADIKKRAKLKKVDSDDESSDGDFGVLGSGWGCDSNGCDELQLEIVPLSQLP